VNTTNDGAAGGQTTLDGFRGVIFDLDGTLLDTLGDIAGAANTVLAQHGFPVHPVSAYRSFVGEGVQVLLTRALPPDHRDEATVRACLKTMQVEYVRHLNKTTQPYPGIAELLSALQQRGMRLAVLSNKPDEFTAQCVTEFFGAALFAPILGLRADRPRKPDPAGALEIAARWALTSSRVLYLGDSGTDMRTAAAAGMFAVGVLWGYRDHAELASAGAKRLLARPLDLLGQEWWKMTNDE
jgi:phosphoglycolate phosphatase